ncbi:3-dehydroquinate synthase [Mycoplasmatota bacterium]|nr:3-dehydroquinate synthase [Mycoplasmatota bacterium]
MKITIYASTTYDVIIKRSILDELDKHIDCTKETVIITDNLIPKEYVSKVSSYFNAPLVIELPSGENTKSFEHYINLMTKLVNKNVTRAVQIIALGGGVIGDLSGFVASTFMRGVDFIQIPTTLLAQIDSSVGGKVAINHLRKNIIGSFYQPKKVIIDPDTLKTLEDRQFNNGVAEMIKYGLIYDKNLFRRILNEEIKSNIEEYIYRCIEIKRDIVVEDERDYGRRHILNFGHTVGHAVEVLSDYGYLHGEAISIGMVSVINDERIKKEVIKVLRKYSLPTHSNFNIEDIIDKVKNDKKAINDKIKIVLLDDIGKGRIKEISISELKQYIRM